MGPSGSHTSGPRCVYFEFELRFAHYQLDKDTMSLKRGDNEFSASATVSAKKVSRKLSVVGAFPFYLRAL